MLKAALFLLLMPLSVCSSALADTLTLSGTLINNGLFGETVSFNSTTGVFTGTDFDAVEGLSAYLFDSSTTSQFSPEVGVFLGEFSDGLGDLFYLDIPGTNLIGYAGGLVCSQLHVCQGSQKTFAWRFNARLNLFLRDPERIGDVDLAGHPRATQSAVCCNRRDGDTSCRLAQAHACRT